MPNYATAAEYRSYKKTDDTDGKYADAIINLYLDEAEQWIDWYCGRHFGSPGSEEINFWGEGIDLLKIDPCISVTAVKELEDDGTETELQEGSDYLLLPPDKSRQSADYHQYTHIQRTPRGGFHLNEYNRSNGWGYDGFYSQGNVWRVNRRYAVTATFGMSSVPPGIKLATLEFAALRRIETPRAQNAAVMSEDESMMSPEAQGIIMKYLRRWRLPDLENKRGRA